MDDLARKDGGEANELKGEEKKLVGMRLGSYDRITVSI
jgi:hypothetical protein